MNNFFIGNVIKSPYDNMEVVIESKDEYIVCIPLDSSNSVVYHKKDDTIEHSTCICTYESEDGMPNDECEDCMGTGEVTSVILGYKHATVIASTIKNYIKESILKNFNF